MKRNSLAVPAICIRFFIAQNHLPKGTNSLSFPRSHTTSTHSSSSSSSSSSIHKPQIKNRLLLGLGVFKFNNNSISNLDDALSVFHRMVRMRPLPSTIQFNQLLGLINRMKHYSAAVSLFREMRLLGIPVDVYTMNTVINCYCHLNRVDFGFAVLGGLFKCGYVPDVVTFGTLIKGLFSESKIAEAEGLFKKLMREKEIEPNEVMYGTVVNGLCKAGNTSMAHEILRLMEKGSCKPDLVVYSTIIDSLCKDKMVNEALDLLYEMIQNRIMPNVVTYSSLIQGLCNFGRWKEATRIFNEMVDQKIL